MKLLFYNNKLYYKIMNNRQLLTITIINLLTIYAINGLLIRYNNLSINMFKTITFTTTMSKTITMSKSFIMTKSTTRRLSHSSTRSSSRVIGSNIIKGLTTASASKSTTSTTSTTLYSLTPTTTSTTTSHYSLTPTATFSPLPSNKIYIPCCGTWLIQDLDEIAEWGTLMCVCIPSKTRTRTVTKTKTKTPSISNLPFT